MYRQDWLEGCVRQVRRGAAAARLLRARVFDLGYEAQRVRRAHMGEDERAAVMGGNAVALFALATEGGA